MLQSAEVAEPLAPSWIETTVPGLTSGEAAARLRTYGSNDVRDTGTVHPLTILLNQFRSPLVLILIVAAALSVAVGEAAEAEIIAAIVLASSGLSFFQEYRASNAVQKLRARLAVMASVRRDGRLQQIPIKDVVPGDVLELAAGNLVAADATVIGGRDLQVDEAALTGESIPLVKVPAHPSDTPAAENLVRMGTSIRSGTGTAVVTETGGNTEFGRIIVSVAAREPETSFARGIRRFGLLMTQVMLVIVAIILPINILLGRPLIESVLFSAALAVGLTPELLPAIVTVTLSRGAQALAKAGLLVRRLVAIENLGAMNVLCTDKTGTLTMGTIKLVGACDTDGRPSPEVHGLAFLNATLQVGKPNNLDLAIANDRTEANNVDAYSRLDEVPYDFERKRLSVLVDGPEGNVLICKGAVESVLETTSRIRATGEDDAELSAERRAAEIRRLQAWGAQGLRVLAVAVRTMEGRDSCTHADEAGLTLLGYLLFEDPLKPGAAAAVDGLRRHGVGVKVISGDNRYVAAHVAEAIGLDTSRLLTGAEVATMNDRMLARRVHSIAVFAEITPDAKERIVAALRRRHLVVGYLGDGINDAPPLRAADVGISVDSAVDAAREAADIVLLQRDLGVLLEGIIKGRTSFANTMKYIAITTSANLGNMISMALMSLFLPFLPLLAKQILVNNLLSDLPMIAISTDRVDDDILRQAGRWDFRALLQSMIGFGLISSLFDGITFVVLLFVFHANETTFQSGWFLVSLLTEVAIIAVMRTRQPFYASSPSRLLISAALIVAAVGLALPYIPLAGTGLDLQPLPPVLAGALVVIVIAYALASELLKKQMARHSIPLSRKLRRPHD